MTIDHASREPDQPDTPPPDTPTPSPSPDCNQLRILTWAAVIHADGQSSRNTTPGVPAMPRTLPDQYKCSKCAIVQPISEFRVRADAPKGHESACKKCTKETRKIEWDKTRTTIPEPPPHPYSDNPYSWMFVIFRDLPDLPGYGVDTDGNVWSCNSSNGRYRPQWMILRSWREKKNYSLASVVIMNDGKRLTTLVSQLVLKTFMGTRPEGMQCCHNNGKSWDNRLTNLRWDTRQANMDDKYRHGTMNFGSQQYLAKLTEEYIPDIKRYAAQGISIAEIGRMYGVSHTAIRFVVKGKTWRHVKANGSKQSRKSASEKETTT